MKRGATSREKGSSKRSNDKPPSEEASIDAKPDNNGLEVDNNNVDVKVEPGSDDFLDCKEENGESSPAMDISEQVNNLVCLSNLLMVSGCLGGMRYITV